MRTAAAAIVLAAVLLGCGGSPGDPSVDGAGAPSDTSGSQGDKMPASDGATTLRPCEADDELTRTTLVEGSGETPSDDELEDLIASSDNPDLSFMVEQRAGDEAARRAALVAGWVQLGGGRILAAARDLPGFVEAAYGSIEQGEPFVLRFADTAPSLDAITADPVIRAVGLDVVTGTGGPAADLGMDAYAAAIDLGMRVVGGSGDSFDDTFRIEVIEPDPDAAATWEAEVDDARVCLVHATPTTACDQDVVSAAEDRADSDRPVLPNTEEAPPDPDRAEQVRRSYLGLTLAEAESKATGEGRAVRTVVEQGVELGRNDDLQPGRLGLTLCDGVVVDTQMDLEGAGG